MQEPKKRKEHVCIAVQILPYWTCPGCHVGRVVHLATGILVLQVLLVIAVTSLFYIVYRLIVVYSVVVDCLVCKCDSEATRVKLNSLSDPRHPWGRFHARSIIVSYRVIVLLS
jgi:hypothetical protein